MDRVRTRFGRDAVIRGKLYGAARRSPRQATDDDQSEGR